MTAVVMLTNTIRGSKPSQADSSWPAVLSHSHMLRSHRSPYETAKENLVEWARREHIHAVGVGSPWEPVSSEHYRIYETTERNAYSAGRVDPQSVMDREHIASLFEDLNRRSQGATLFYHDNETPKGRNGHMWYFGYHYNLPAWHDYSQDRPVQYYDLDPHVEINPLNGKPHRRRTCMEAAADQRAAGAVAVWAHPTSWWLEPKDGSFVTNIASEMPLALMADGYLDGMVVQGYDAWHRDYQALWFALLDLGAIVPGFGEIDGCFDSKTLPPAEKLFFNRMHVEGKVSVESITGAARRGNVFASNGPFLTLSVDDCHMGSILRTKPGATHTIRVEAYPAPGENNMAVLQIIGKGGTVLAEEKNFTGGVLMFSCRTGSTPDYIVARVCGEHDKPFTGRQQDIKYCAITNPVYLHAPGYEFRPVETQCTFKFGQSSPWIDGSARFETPSGKLLDTAQIQRGPVTVTLPGNTRVRLQNARGEERSFFIATENARAQELSAYLSFGGFLRDFPDRKPGEVPVKAFKLDEIRVALQMFEMSL